MSRFAQTRQSTPGKSRLRAWHVTALLILLQGLTVGAPPSALARKPKKPTPAPHAVIVLPTPTPSASGSSGAPGATAASPPPQKPPSDDPRPALSTDGGGRKSKTYTFTGLDIDGRLKTPQLLYFLNRMKSEFDSTTPTRRSFLPELKRSTDEM